MEILDKDGKAVRRQPYRRDKNLFLGIAIILCGIIWLLHNLDMIGDLFFCYFFSWQMLLIALGGYLLVFRKWIAGGAMLAVGASFALTDWFGMNVPVKEVVLPLILIAAGLSVLFQKKG